MKRLPNLIQLLASV